jgi:hypothetical protein
MSTNKRITKLIDYTNILPYASEVFGIYQPLLGWKSKRIEKRFQKGLNNDKKILLDLLKDQFIGKLQIEYGEGCEIKILDLKPGNYSVGNINSFDSIILSKISEELPDFENYKESIWNDLISNENIEIIFKEFVTPHYKAFYHENCKGNESPFPGRNVGRINSNLNAKAVFDAAFEKQLKYESALAGSLLFLAKNKNFEELKNTFYNSTNNKDNAIKLIKALSAEKTEDAYLSLENLSPRDKEQIKSVALSPISVVHLFRQYFFELDTFLGTPVGHVWLSPGSSVELIEVSTRKTIVEKNLETILETITKSEKSTTE